MLRVLGEASEPLHWTVVQDRALTWRHPRSVRGPDVREAVLTAPAGLAAEGRIAKYGKGVYAIAPSSDGQIEGPIERPMDGQIEGSVRRGRGPA